MKRLLIAPWLVLVVAGAACAQSTATFDDLPLPPNGFMAGDASEAPFVSDGVTFTRTWDQEFDCCAGGWTYSNLTNLTLQPGDSDYFDKYAYSAYVLPSGGGTDGSSNFGVSFGDGSSVLAPTGEHFTSMRITNNTYAALAMLQGDSFAKRFGGATGNDPDWFRLSIQGFDTQGDPVGTVDFYLADFRDANNANDYIVSQWTEVDLSSLVGASELRFTYDGSDVGPFGLNTPSYFAADNLVTVPEPGTLLLSITAIASALLWGIRRRHTTALL